MRTPMIVATDSGKVAPPRAWGLGVHSGDVATDSGKVATMDRNTHQGLELLALTGSDAFSLT